MLSTTLLYTKPRLPGYTAPLAALAAGIISGATGKGGGSLYTPIAATLSNDTRRAATTARLLAATTSATALMVYTPLETHYAILSAISAAASYTGSEVGSRLLLEIKPDAHHKMLTTVYTTLAALTIAKALLSSTTY